MPSSPDSRTAPRVLIFIVAFNHETTIQQVLRRIPAELESYDTEVLIIDDASGDATFERSSGMETGDLPFPVTTLRNPVNQGYGGNQKIGFHYAIEKGFDVVGVRRYLDELAHIDQATDARLQAGLLERLAGGAFH